MAGLVCRAESSRWSIAASWAESSSDPGGDGGAIAAVQQKFEGIFDLPALESPRYSCDMDLGAHSRSGW